MPNKGKILHLIKAEGVFAVISKVYLIGYT
jgi:hypothetical protein